MFKKFLSTLWAYTRHCFSTRLLKLAHLFLLVFLIFILIEWQHENNLYRNIARMAQIHASSKADTAVVQEAMTNINSTMQSRSAIFQGKEQLSLKQNVLRSADIHLMYGSGACGGYSMVLARTLQVMGYEVRIGQLKAIKGGWGAHIIIEYYSTTLRRWIMIDPLFQFIPRTKNGKMASVKYLAKYWAAFEGQMPDDFKNQYRYTNVRYTNWDKFGGILKPYYHLAKFFMGKPYADTICLRMYRLSTFPLLFWSIELGYLGLFAFGFFRFRRGRIKLKESKK
jgi:hypothetical protein